MSRRAGRRAGRPDDADRHFRLMAPAGCPANVLAKAIKAGSRRSISVVVGMLWMTWKICSSAGTRAWRVVLSRQCGLDGLLEYFAAGAAWSISQPAKFLLGPTDGANSMCRRKEMFDGPIDVRQRRIVTAAGEQMRDGE